MESSAAMASGDRGTGYLAATYVVFGISLIIVGLRFWSRCFVTARRKFWWDDWSALAALVIMAGIVAYDHLLYHYGFGHHLGTLTPHEITQQLKVTYAGFCFVQFGAYFPKISALFFYQRVFGSHGNRGLIYSCYVMHAISTAWMIGVFFSTVFQCVPAEALWNTAVKGTCIDTIKWETATAALDFVIDVVILLIPMPTIYGLTMSLRKRLLTALVFLLGYIAASVSLARLLVVVITSKNTSPDFSWNEVPLFYMNVFEYAVSLWSVCFPAIFHLCRRISDDGFKSIFSSQYGRTRLVPGAPSAWNDRTPKGVSDISGSYPSRHELKDLSSENVTSWPGKTNLVRGNYIHEATASRVSVTPEREGSTGSIPRDQINVKTVVEVV